jgi:mannitol-1-phosphate/altronate dehydrogenase
LRALCDVNAGDPEATVRAIVSLPKIFGQDLIDEEKFVATVIGWLEKFNAQGVLKTIQSEFSVG